MIKTVPTRMRAVADGVLLVIALVFVVRWTLNPQGPFEPTVALCSVLLAIVDFLYRVRSSTSPSNFEEVSTQTIAETNHPDVAANHSDSKPTGSVETALPSFAHANSSVFFADRFAAAFPGLRSVNWCRGVEAIERLEILLEAPLCFRLPDGGRCNPIWWFGRGNLQIGQFIRLDTRTVLLDVKELQLGAIAAVHSTDYKRQFVYLEAEPMQPTQLYEWTQERIESCTREFGYAWEEYGLYRGAHKVTRAEYDDGSTKIMGKLVRMGREVELRVRYLTKYNMVIAAHDSPINNMDFDAELESWLGRLLTEKSAFPLFVKRVNALSSRRDV